MFSAIVLAASEALCQPLYYNSYILVSRILLLWAIKIGSPYLSLKKLRHISKVSPVSIYWYRQLHVQICVVKHIWREIGVGLCHIQVVDDAIKLFLKVRVVFKIIRPVFRIWL